MKTIFTILSLFFTVICSSQTILTQWNFNTAPASTPSIGTGILTSIGGATNTTASGGTSSDPTQPGLAYQTTAYPTATTNNKTAGIEVAVNTTGYGGIFLRFDLRVSNSAADTYTIQYSTDGVSFTDFATLVPPVNGGTIVFNNNNTYDFSAITALDNNPNVKFRVVSTFSGVGATYLGNNGAYGTTGTVRFDMLTVLRLSVNPITLKSFSAATNDNAITLKWLTANESNIKNYVVEKSENGINFTTMATVNAKNNAENSYQFVDAAITKATLYYRLKIEDVNGKITYSTIARVDNINTKAKLSVYPSLASSSITAKINIDRNTLATIQIFDAIGKIVTQKIWTISSGVNAIPIDIYNLSNGVYRLRIVGENINETSSFIKN